MDADNANDLDAPSGGCRRADDAAVADDDGVGGAHAQIAEIVNDEYDLGEVVRAERIFGGYVNASFAVWTRTRRRRAQVLRAQVQPGDQRARGALRARAAHPSRTPRFRPCLLTSSPIAAARTFVTREEVVDGEPTRPSSSPSSRCSRAKTSTPGSRTASPTRSSTAAPGCSPSSITAAFDFDPGDLAREQPPIMEFVPTLAEHVQGVRGEGDGHRLRRPFPRDKLPAILDVIAKGVEMREPARRAPGERRCTATTTPATSSGWTSKASACSTSTGPSWTTASSTSPRASVLLQLLGRSRQRRAAPRQGRGLRARLPGRGGALGRTPGP